MPLLIATEMDERQVFIEDMVIFTHNPGILKKSIVVQDGGLKPGQIDN